MNTTSSGWEGLLDDGEEIAWQGRPDGAIVWSDLLSFETVFGAFFGGFALFWIAGASAMIGGQASFNGSSGIGTAFSFFPLFGLPFLAIGLYMMVGRIFWDAYRRARTWYTLTDRAAYIAGETLGKRSLKRYAIAEMLPPSLHDGQPGSVIFGQEISTYRTSSRNGPGRTRTQSKPIGFRRIDDARAVYRLIVSKRDALQ